MPVYGETFRRSGSRLMREWVARRSKLATAILKGFRGLPAGLGEMLYLGGASTGTTVSHLSDIYPPRSRIFAVEVALEPFSRLLRLAERRSNIYPPVLDDASFPERYSFFLEAPDLIYQDISQRNQVQIFMWNADHFDSVREAIFILKATSINSREKPPQRVLERAITEFEGSGWKVLNVIDLSPPNARNNYLMHLRR